MSGILACPSSALLLARCSNVIHYPSVILDHSTLFCTSDSYLQRIESLVTSIIIIHSLTGPNYVEVALYGILHPETTCLLWPVHIGPWVVALDRFHCNCIATETYDN